MLALVSVSAFVQAQPAPSPAAGAPALSAPLAPPPVWLIPEPIYGPCTAAWSCPCGLVATCTGKTSCKWAFGVNGDHTVICDGHTVSCFALCYS